jgi:predicted nucleotidyltransferase
LTPRFLRRILRLGFERCQTGPEVRCTALFGSFVKGHPRPRDLDIELVLEIATLAGLIFGGRFGQN